MKLCLHVSDPRRARALRAKRIAHQRLKRRVVNISHRGPMRILPLAAIWPHMSRRERIAANLVMAGVRLSARNG